MHQPKPFYRKQREQWEVEYEPKKRKRLCGGPKNAETEKEAWRRYHLFMASLGRGTPGKELIVGVAADLYLQHAERTVTPGAYEQYRIKINDFVRTHGRRKISSVEAFHVSEWVNAHDWSDSTRRGAITAIKVMFAWCARKKIVAIDPVKDMKRPRMGRRERTLTPAERAKIRQAVEGPLLDYLDALTWTGARPGEIMRLEAAHVEWDEAVARMPGKTTEATGELVEFPLVPPMLALCRRLAARHPDGPLFRNADENPWTPNAVRCRMRRLREKMKKAGMKLAGVTAYTYRHSFATDALERGVPVTDVAALMNHKDIRTTMNYNHIKGRRDHLRKQARKAVGGDPPEGAG
jgi:integrase